MLPDENEIDFNKNLEKNTFDDDDDDDDDGQDDDNPVTLKLLYKSIINVNKFILKLKYMELVFENLKTLDA